jgi:hypothetical protein
VYNPPQEKRPRLPRKEDDPFFCWRTDHADLSDNQWGWGCISLAEFFQKIAPKLLQLEESTWGQMIGRDQVHFFAQADIAPKAQRRLYKLAEKNVIPEDWLGEDLTSIRIAGAERIWGFKNGKYFFLLWWDPDHTVYPVEKRHT